MRVVERGGDQATRRVVGRGGLGLPGAVHKPVDRWRLSDTVNDTRGNNLTASASVSFVSDATRNSKVLSLPGTSDALVSTAGQSVDTSGSYTVSAWAYLANTNGYSTVVGQSGTNTSAFYLQYNKQYNAWTFVMPSNDAASPNTWSAAYAKTPPALNTWTHLVATFDATTGAMTLYVDGKAAATATNSSPWASTGPLTIGSAKTGDYFPGRIGDVQLWKTALPPAGVTALNSPQPVLTQLS
ncbi:LamG domain-containing protein [Kitasatospora sp. NPDC088391]|uniref:LamG domain-containing protein n=1 Tax=Kitasatospora sp. NPDC088391 TaxID=3364074 RepID=UPI003812A8AD